jgi:hypothetical protein
MHVDFSASPVAVSHTAPNPQPDLEWRGRSPGSSRTLAVIAPLLIEQFLRVHPHCLAKKMLVWILHPAGDVLLL